MVAISSNAMDSVNFECVLGFISGDYHAAMIANFKIVLMKHPAYLCPVSLSVRLG